MRHSVTEVTVGAVVLAAAIGFAVYAGQVAGIGQSAGYPLQASFRSVEGIAPGTDVRLAGVRIGQVSDIRLNPETYRADTVITIRNGIDIPDDSAIVIASEGLLGGNFIEIMPGGSPFILSPGEEIVDTQGAVSLLTLLLRYVGGGE